LSYGTGSGIVRWNAGARKGLRGLLKGERQSDQLQLDEGDALALGLVVPILLIASPTKAIGLLVIGLGVDLSLLGSHLGSRRSRKP
jgi:hypothetical protein